MKLRSRTSALFVSSSLSLRDWVFVVGGLVVPTRFSLRLIVLLLCTCLSLAILTGCVSETTKPTRGVKLSPDGSRFDRKPKDSNPSTIAADLGTGAVAEPVTGASLASRVRIAVIPRGSIPYDGVTLPLVSPDGRFIATQIGEAPTWPTIFASNDAQFPRSTLEVFSIAAGPASRVGWSTLPAGNLILGRSANDEGFLAESIESDGTRTIVLVAWATGRTETLARENGKVFAHATFLSRGELCYTARPVSISTPNSDLTQKADAPDSSNTPSSELRLIARDGSVSTKALDDGSYAYPIATADDRFVYALAVRTPEAGARVAKLEIHAIRIERDNANGSERLGSARLGSVAWRFTLGDATEPFVLHQFAAAVAQPGPVGLRMQFETAATLDASQNSVGRDLAIQAELGPDLAAPLTLFRPGSRRAHVLDMDKGRSLPLPATTIAAAWLNPARFASTTEKSLIRKATPGFLCSTSEGLLFMPDPRKITGRVSPVRLLSGQYIARPTRFADEFVLLGPVPNAPDRMEVVRALLGDKAGPE